jgi:hypothetical protein
MSKITRFWPVLPAILLALVAGSNSASNVLKRSSPELAIAAWPGQAVAYNSIADRFGETQEPSHAQLRRSVWAARNALAIEPSNARALRTMGLLAERKAVDLDPKRLMLLASRYSRRDLATQIWLIQDAAKRRDYAAVVSHGDAALRTNEGSRKLILPVFAAALSDPNMLPPIAACLRRPTTDWAQHFWATVPKTPQSFRNIPALLNSLKTSNSLPDPGLLADIVAAMITRGQFVIAANTVEAALPGKNIIVRSGMNDRQFAPGKGPAPFEWQYVETGQLDAKPVRDGGLFIDVSRSGGGLVGRRLLALRPGLYTLRAEIKAEDALQKEVPFIRLRCAESRTARDFAFTNDKSRLLVNSKIDVAPECRFQWLELQSPPVERIDVQSSELVHLEIRRAS